MKSAGKARNNGLYRHIRTSKEIIRNLLNDFSNKNSRLGSKYWTLPRRPLYYRFCRMIRVMMPTATPRSISRRVTAKDTSSFFPGIR